MKKKWRHWALCAVLAAGSALAAWLASNVRFFQILNLKAYDAHFVVRDFLGRRPAIPNIVLLLNDQKARDTFPELVMFWHQHYANAIRAAGQAGAKVIGLDVAFGIPVDKYEPDFDRMLGEAVSTSPVPVVCAYATDLNTNPDAQRIPINILSAALGQAGYANLYSDSDDFVRRQELTEAPSRNPNDPPPAHSFALRIAEKYAGTDATYQNGRLMFQGQVIPIASDPPRTIDINYAGPPGTFPSVSLADFEAAWKAGNMAQLRKWVDGKIVLIGTDDLDDRRATPFFTLFSGTKWLTPGVEIHANTVRTLLTRSYLVPAPQWALVLALLASTLLAVLVVSSFDVGRAVFLVLLEAVVILVATHAMFERGLILSTSEVLLATLIGLVTSLVYRWATEETRGDLFHRAISLFVGKQVASSLEETSAIALSGQRMEVTILFTDIRGFTAFTEQVCDEQGPEVVVQLLNEYMAMMVGIIVVYRGHVNKFIGDGILAVFSDSDEGAEPGDHALRAVQCATRMVTAPSRFSTGAGIHTGQAVVGNVGSADKMEFTVLGDTVNLASRLESLNKEHHTKLLMTDATECKLSQKVETLRLGQVPVRGKALPIELFTVASLVAQAVVNA
ncbi:MAG TPA: adenylate/guanylate cyclase domain-containing protein [Bryobacteraceae bacterium]|nr:adenylate/guanylate cyclase domain-containing protein [Bryobacteraceae bacterium]